jgi:hypothetical protein
MLTTIIPTPPPNNSKTGISRTLHSTLSVLIQKPVSDSHFILTSNLKVKVTQLSDNKSVKAGENKLSNVPELLE